jgi:hypothetical protein
MLSKATTVTMLLVAALNLFSANAVERVSVCSPSSDEEAFVVSAHADTAEGDSIASVAHEEGTPCDDACQHPEGCHQCHLGHCHYLGASILTGLPSQAKELGQAFFDPYWPNPFLLSLDKPPRA